MAWEKPTERGERAGKFGHKEPNVEPKGEQTRYLGYGKDANKIAPKSSSKFKGKGHRLGG